MSCTVKGIFGSVRRWISSAPCRCAPERYWPSARAFTTLPRTDSACASGSCTAKWHTGAVSAQRQVGRRVSPRPDAGFGETRPLSPLLWGGPRLRLAVGRHDQVVPVNHFVIRVGAQHGANLLCAHAFDLARIGGGIIRETAGEFDPGGVA